MSTPVILAISAAALILLLFAVYLILLMPRRNHPGWEKFSCFRYAHRGLHDKDAGIPENSLIAFRRAADHGFGAELDVHLLRDGSLAVFHDFNLQRMCGADVLIETLTAEELKRYTLLGTEEHIPMLDEVLAIFEGKTPLIIELKVDNNTIATLASGENNVAALTNAVMDKLKGWNGTYCIESFHPGVVAHLKKHYPNVIRGQLSENFMKNPKVRFIPAFPMTYLLSTVLTRPDFIAYAHKDRSCISLKIMRRIYGVHEVGWTIRERDTMAALERDGVTPIFENFIP